MGGDCSTRGESQDAEFAEGLPREHSGRDGVAHFAFGTDFLPRSPDDLRFDPPRYDDHPVFVGDDQIARREGDAVDFHRDVEVDHALPILAVVKDETAGVHREAHELHAREIADFKQRLEAALKRQVTSVRLTVLRGHSVECSDVDSAIAYLIEEEKSYRLREDGEQREAFEVQVRFNTGAKIEATFPKRAEAIAFLRSFA